MRGQETTLCYIEKDGAYLMIHRTKKKNDVNHDKWLGIGGHFEAGESPLDCAKREVLEETGLTVVNPRYCGIITFVYNGESEYMHLFHVPEYTGTLAEFCDEGELAWVPKEALRSLPLWEGDFLFLDLMESGAPFFSMKLNYDLDGTLLSHETDFVAKKPLAISACLLGIPCRYDGKSQGLPTETVEALSRYYTLVPICPEILGGLPTPRIPSERQKDGTVVSRIGEDVTRAFTEGADSALRICELNGIRCALLKSRSPSCGCGTVYDGTFSGITVHGYGVTAELFGKAGIRVETEDSVSSLIRELGDINHDQH